MKHEFMKDYLEQDDKFYVVTLLSVIDDMTENGDISQFTEIPKKDFIKILKVLDKLAKE